MIYNKLVRDKIPEIIISKGATPQTHVADEKEYWTKLKEKLNEEVAEFQENNSVEELADIMEVVYAILNYQKISLDGLENIRKMKLTERGGFTKKIILEETK